VRRAVAGRARAALAEAEVDLGYTVIRAPVAGTVASVSTSVGETVAASFAAPTFVTIVDLDRLEVQAYVDESDIGRVEVGQAVALRVDAFAGRELPGAVRAIYPKAELVNNVVNYVVIVDLVDRQGLLLRPEMTVHADFLLERRDDALAVPRAALVDDGARSYLIVADGSRFEERVVTTGLRTPQRIEIVSGLEEGETIVADKQAWRAWRRAGRQAVREGER
jgi:HlyD family secretion protein